MQTDSVASLLADYAHGDLVTPIRAVASVSADDFKAFRDRFEKQAEAWANVSDAQEAARRRLVVATFVLEVVHSARATSRGDRAAAGGSALSAYLALWSDQRPLVEWACRLLRQEKTPSPAERLWYLASLDEIHDPPFVYGFPAKAHVDQRDRDAYREYGAAVNHLDHAKSRFPDEPYFKLLTIDHERAGHGCVPIGSQIWARVELSSQQISAWQRQASAAKSAADAYRWVQDQVFVTLVNDPTKSTSAAQCAAANRTIERKLASWNAPDSVRDDVEFELGALMMLFGERAGAIGHFRAVAGSSDLYFKYLSHLLAGRTFQTDGDLAAAEVEYRNALGVLPDTPSASAALATVLFLQGKADEAERPAASALEKLDAHDPWSDFVNGQHERWAGLIGPLRAAFVR